MYMASAGESKNDIEEDNSGTELLPGALSGRCTPPSLPTYASTHSHDSDLFPASPTAQSDAVKTAQMDSMIRGDISNIGGST
jgi:hypothetical protein